MIKKLLKEFVMNFNIKQFLDLSNYATEERVSRRKGGSKSTQEFFTPYSIVKRMCDKVSEDYDKSGKIDVNDFLDMNNEDILKENGNKRWDICLMNPPYGHTGSNTIHLQFVEKCLNIANEQVVIFPYSFVTKKNNKSNNKFKETFSKYLESIEEVDSRAFNVAMGSCGIYKFNNKESDNIEIKQLDGNIYNINSLLSLSNFSDYEKEIIEYLERHGSQDIIGDCGRLNNWKAQIQGLNNIEKKEKILELVKRSLRKVKKYYNEYPNSYGLLVNKSNGGMNGTALSSKNGQILNNYNEFIDYFCKNLLGAGYCSLMFKSKLSAENCKEALKHPLLRFTLYRLQDDQNMVPRVYKYIPAIDWSDNRVKTDEGLLEVCGCPKDKCKEYAEYCKKIIDEVDKK